MFRQGFDQGGARFNRLEGIWWDGEDSMFFASTSGGDVKSSLTPAADGYRPGLRADLAVPRQRHRRWS